MSDIKARLVEAADYLDCLRDQCAPVGLVSHEMERGDVLVYRENDPVHPLAQFWDGAAAGVFIALGPAALPMIGDMLRIEAAADQSPTSASMALANHILKAKGRQA